MFSQFILLSQVALKIAAKQPLSQGSAWRILAANLIRFWKNLVLHGLFLSVVCSGVKWSLWEHKLRIKCLLLYLYFLHFLLCLV